MARGIGIRDVAKRAEVSVTTVSHVLNDVPDARVHPDTRARVRRAAAELGYVPNRMARGLRTHRSDIIGLISDSIATTPYAGKIIVGAHDAALRLGRTLVLVNTEADPVVEERDVDALLRHQVDGVIYATMYHRHVTLPVTLADTPTVLLDATSGSGDVPSVVPDEVGGGRTATEELLRHGHRRIGFATNVDDVPATHGRLAGYQQALAVAGIAFDDNLVVAAESETWGGYHAARQLLDRDDRPTALFCYNDRMAMGAYRAAAELGLAIPTDLSIVGFDNQELIAVGLHPRLTTVALPHYEMGSWAVDRLVAMIDNPDPKHTATEPTHLLCPLVRRDSVSEPAAQRQKW
jgi:LacI family transcriptional regulator